MTKEQIQMGEAIDFNQVQRYLLNHGWRQAKSHTDEINIFRFGHFEAWVPLTRSFADYASGMVDVAKGIAGSESRSIDSVLADLLRPNSDTVRFSRRDQGTEDGSLGLDDGAQFLAGARRSLLAAACSVETPGVRYFKRLSNKTAARFIDSCRLGQTHRGSFVLTVHCPVDVPSEEQPREGFGRAAVTTLLSSIHDTVVALRRGDLAALSQMDSPPITANLCDALIEMMPGDAGSDLQLNASWSAALPSPANFESSVEIPRDLFSQVEELGSRLRPVNGDQSSQFVGRVVELSGEGNADGQLEGEVTLDVFLQQELVRARCRLGPHEYRVALEAHAKQKLIALQASLRRRPRRSVLENPIDVRLV